MHTWKSFARCTFGGHYWCSSCRVDKMLISCTILLPNPAEAELGPLVIALNRVSLTVLKRTVVKHFIAGGVMCFPRLIQKRLGWSERTVRKHQVPTAILSMPFAFVPAPSPPNRSVGNTIAGMFSTVRALLPASRWPPRELKEHLKLEPEFESG